MTLLEAPPRDPLTARPYSVSTIRQETHDVVSVDIRPETEPVAFQPGQFDMVYVFGVGEAAISISSDPADPTLYSHTIRSVGWVTRALNDLQPGARIGIRGPFGRPWPLDAAVGKDLVIVAGGIGLAPVRPAILEAIRQRGRFNRLLILVGARSPRDLVFRGDLERWDRDRRVGLHVSVDAAARGWTGRVGVVTKMIPRAPFDPDNAVVFTCGPEVMMRFTARALLGRGVAPENIYVTLERNMRCAVGTCGHCQIGPKFVCRDGAVFTWPEVGNYMEVREL